MYMNIGIAIRGLHGRICIVYTVEPR